MGQLPTPDGWNNSQNWDQSRKNGVFNKEQSNITYLGLLKMVEAPSNKNHCYFVMEGNDQP